MKLTRKEFLKTICALPFVSLLGKSTHAKKPASPILIVPEELESRARKLWSTQFNAGDMVVLGDSGTVEPYKGKGPIYGQVEEIREDGWVDVRINRFVRTGR